MNKQKEQTINKEQSIKEHLITQEEREQYEKEFNLFLESIGYVDYVQRKKIDITNNSDMSNNPSCPSSDTP